MQTISEINADKTLTFFEKGARIRALAEAPRPQPAPMSPAEAAAARKQAAIAALPRHRAALTSLAEALQAHDAKVVDYDSMREPLQAEVNRALAGVIDLINHAELQGYIDSQAKLTIIRNFLANASRLRSEICASVEHELKGLAATLDAAGKLDHARPPQFLAGHGLESRVQLALAHVEEVLK